MAVKTDRLEARLSTYERDLIERAASTTGMSVSAFVVGAAVVRADEVIAAQTTTVVPPDYFDSLLEGLDAPDAAPHLAQAAKRARQDARITSR